MKYLILLSVLVLLTPSYASAWTYEGWYPNSCAHYHGTGNEWMELYFANELSNVTIQSYTGAANITVNNGTANIVATVATDDSGSGPFMCFNLNTILATVTGISSVTANRQGYVSRAKYINMTNGSTIANTYYLLASGAGIYHSIYVSSATGAPIENALVTIQKPVGNIYITLSHQYTDTTGLSLNYLDSSTNYRFAVTKSGYGSETFNSIPNPVSPIIYVRLTPTSGSGADYVNISTIFSNISYSFLPTLLYQNVTFNVSFSVTDPDSKITYQKINATYPNGSLMCSTASTIPGGTTVLCPIPAAFGIYCVRGMIARTGFDNFTFDPICYQFYNSTAGLGGIHSIIKSSLSDMGYFVVAIVVTLCVCAFLATFGGGVVVAFAAVGMFAFLAALNPTAVIPMGGLMIPFWSIAALMAMFAVGIMVLRSYI